ncbi:MAG: MFS transporter, partial [Kangiellaceae bacterium]|nr:MFS transporter [Kangiellaceae bacterium]
MLKDYYRFTSTNYHFLSFGLLTAFFGNFGQTFFIAWFGESIQQDFNLSAGEYGLLYSSATLTSGLIILYAGALLDKSDLRKFTFITSLGLLAGCGLMFFSEHAWQLVVAIFLLRFCGQGLMFHIAFTSMARYFNDNRGKAIGVVGFGMPLGEAILPFLAVLFISQLGWRESWLVFGTTVIILYWPFFNYLLSQSKQRLAQLKAADAHESDTQKTSWTRGQVAKDIRFWMLIPAIMAPAFIVTGIFIHQGVLLKHMQWSETWFATSFIVYAIFHLKASLITGGLVDKYSGKKLIRFYLLPILAAVGLLALPFDHPFIALVFMFLTGLTIGAS